MKETSLALSEHMNLEAISEELVYIPSYTNTQGTDSQYEGAGDTVDLELFWIIYFDITWWKEKYAAIDAVSGEVYYIDNSV